MTPTDKQADWKRYEDEESALVEAFGVCGCGIPDECIDAMAGLLESAQKWQEQPLQFDFSKPKDPDAPPALYEAVHSLDRETLEYIAMYHLDKMDLIEHGTSIGGSWPSENGKEALELWRKYKAPPVFDDGIDA